MAEQRLERKWALDTKALHKAIVAKATAQGVSLREACKQAGVSHNTTTRLLNGQSVGPDQLVSLLYWLNPEQSARLLGHYAVDLRTAA